MKNVTFVEPAGNMLENSDLEPGIRITLQTLKAFEAKAEDNIVTAILTGLGDIAVEISSGHAKRSGTLPTDLTKSVYIPIHEKSARCL